MSDLAIKSAQVQLQVTLMIFRLAVRLTQKDTLKDLKDAPELKAFEAELLALWHEIQMPNPDGSKLEEIWGVVQHYSCSVLSEDREYENLDWAAAGVNSAISLYRSFDTAEVP